jgi:S1-C subfamily serine protease
VLEALARDVLSLTPSRPAATQLDSRAVDVARRAVVRVAAFHGVGGRSDDSGPPSRSGFGFVVNENGILLTAGRLVSDATKVAVILQDGRTLPIATVAIDPLNDVAVLQVRTGGLSAVRLGSSGELEVGDKVIALGGPVVDGIVGTLRATGAATGGDLVTDARPSGQVRTGLPLLNIRGEVIGVLNTTTSSGDGGVFERAVPIDRVKRLLRDLGPVAAETTKAASPAFGSDR